MTDSVVGAMKHKKNDNKFKNKAVMRKTVIMLIVFVLVASSCKPVMNLLSGTTRKGNLIVFVGEKIEVKSLGIYPSETIKGIILLYDEAYIAEYKILQLVHGSYKSDTIEFTVYDHYGEPAFSKFQTVLLFISKHNGKLFHEKYLYFDLYMTNNGEWASPYSSQAYNHPFKNRITVKPELISFIDEVSYSVEDMDADEIEKRFPQPYYKIEEKRAIAVYGNYVEDLFILEQQTTLKARGIY